MPGRTMRQATPSDATIRRAAPIMGRVAAGLRRQGTRFAQDRRGATMVMFTLAALPVVFAAGAALDYSRASALQSRLQQATDMAALAVGGKGQTLTDTQIAERARAEFLAVLGDKAPGAWLDPPLISTGRTEIALTGNLTYKPLIVQMDGLGPFQISAKSKTVISDTSFEIALVLDNSGSMSSSAGGKSKMAAAKDAAKKLVETMYAQTQSATRTKMALVPFTLTVNAGNQYRDASWVDTTGQSSIHWQNISRGGSAWQPGSRFSIFEELDVSWAGCFETRPGTWGTTDAPPNGGVPDSLFVPMFAPDEPGPAGTSTYFHNTGNNAGSGTRSTYPNSYLSDTGGSCVAGSLPATTDVQGRQAAICKYQINKDKSKLSLSSNRGPNRSCDARPLTRLTSSTSVLNSRIDDMRAGGNTNLFEGVAWGWRTLSPSQPFADGAGYDDPKTRKIIILMTDGMNRWDQASNHNGSGYSPFSFYKDARLGSVPTSSGSATDAIDRKTRETCAAAKARGVQIYTVGFSVEGDSIDAKGLSVLKDCATMPNMAYVASNSDQIVNVFEEIARSIGTLRLAQ